jgi:hypothetical protein
MIISPAEATGGGPLQSAISEKTQQQPSQKSHAAIQCKNTDRGDQSWQRNCRPAIHLSYAHGCLHTLLLSIVRNGAKGEVTPVTQSFGFCR